jgi:hypothetical protein
MRYPAFVASSFGSAALSYILFNLTGIHISRDPCCLRTSRDSSSVDQTQPCFAAPLKLDPLR